MSISISDGIIRKKQKRNGSWEWQACLDVTIDGKRTQKRKLTGIPCDPQKPSERGAGKRITPTGKGARQAQAVLREWREQLLAEHNQTAEATQTGIVTYDLGTLVDEYWATRDIKKSTYKGYHNLRKHIVKIKGRACDIRPADMQKWITDEQKAGVGPATIKKLLYN